ncbi:MAG: hypothetical protein H6706_24740 [Myxococcales bacterium]|nr:hypothetical protein [Myxococcales bacterium]
MEVDVDLSDLAAPGLSVADHPLEHLRGAPSGGRSDGVAYKVALGLLLLALLIGALWYLHSRTISPHPGDARISTGSMHPPG